MHRIDGPNSLPGNVFREGDPTVGVEATTVTADWCNAVQSEFASVIEGAGLSLNKPDNTQLLQAIQLLMLQSMPVGTVIEGYWLAAPLGFVLADGSLLPRAGSGARLWAHVQAQAGLVVSDAVWLAGDVGRFSSGDGSTTFRLPRLGGRFTRALDNGAGVDSGRALGSLQDWATGAPKTPGRGFARMTAPGEAVTADGVDSVGSGAQLDVINHTTGDAETRPTNVALQRAIRL